LTPRRPPLFIYGTLLDPAVRRFVLGPKAAQAVRPAVLHGYRRLSVAGKDYPAVERAPMSRTAGGILPPPGPVALARLDAFEGTEYRRLRVRATVGGRLLTVETYAAAPGLPLLGTEWRLDARWSRRRGRTLRRWAL